MRNVELFGVPFAFELLQDVVIDVSGQAAYVTGRAQYYDRENRYILRYADNVGNAIERSWAESALSAMEPEEGEDNKPVADAVSDVVLLGSPEVVADAAAPVAP